MRSANRFAAAICPWALVGCLAVPLGARPGWAQDADSGSADMRMSVEWKGEHRDVGMKRMEILDKELTPEVLRKKKAYIRSIEEDYDRKIGELVQRLTTAIGRNTVITHVDVQLLDPGFDEEVRAMQNVTVTVLLDSDGFAKWSAGKGSDDAAADQMQALIHRTFRIPQEQISIVLTPN